MRVQVRLPERAVVVGVALTLLLTAVIGSPVGAAEPPGALAVPKNQPEVGLVYDGLRRSGDPRCAGAFEVGDTGTCTPGPMAPPEGFDVKRDVEPVATGMPHTTAVNRPDLPVDGGRIINAPPNAGGIETSGGREPNLLVCDGDGVSGNRTLVMYVRASDVIDRFATFSASIGQWAAEASRYYDRSANKTDGKRNIRFRTVADTTMGGCKVDVFNVVLSPTGDDTFQNTVTELTSLGYSSLTRKYLIFMDANVYCGLAHWYSDSRPGQENYNNAGAGASPMYARLDTGCWGGWIAAHNHATMLGAVQSDAPNADGQTKCVDDYDIMCYDTPSPTPMRIDCPDYDVAEWRFDCDNDDYLHMNPPSGSYLATHWNLVNSAFLIAGFIPGSACGNFANRGVYLTSGIFWGGRCSYFSVDDGDFENNTVQPEAARAIWVVGKYRVTLYRGPNFTGLSETFTFDSPGGDSDLSNNAIRIDRVQSVRMVNLTACDGSAGVYLYADISAGNCTRLTEADSGFSDDVVGDNTVSSVHIVGNYQARLYANEDFTGASTHVRANDTSLTNDAVGDNATSSVRISVATGDPPNCTRDPFSDVNANHSFCPHIDWVDLNGVANGFTDGTFRSTANVTRQAMAAFLARLAGADAAQCTSAPFSDVPTTHPFCAEIDWLSSRGVIRGFSDGTFRPSANVSREATAAFVTRLVGVNPAPCTAPPFSDVPATHAFCKEINWAKENGIVSGFSDGTYRPGNAVTRQAMAAFLYRTFGKLP